MSPITLPSLTFVGDEQRSMSLFEACQQGDADRVKALLASPQCDVTQMDDQDRNVLHYCCELNHIDCARLLLDDPAIKESLLNAQDNEGYSALHLACLNGHTRMVTYLCEQGANVHAVDNEGHSLIHWITVCGHLELFDVLVQYQTPVHTSDVYGAFPVHYASQLSGVNSANDDAIIDPVKGLAILKKLIELNVDVDCTDEQKRTPFLWAASAGATEALRSLYKAGANALHADKDRLTALHCAATRGHASCIRMLVDLYGCPLDSEDVNGCTALFYAVTLQHSPACQVLLDLKANPNHQDNRGRTPSHCAALKGDVDCLKRLVESGADVWTKNKRGDYPIHEAVNATSLSKDLTQMPGQCFLDVVRYIFQLHPAKVNIANGENRTPLHLAASLGDIPMCQLLIDHGARINSFVRTAAGNFLTPYDLARIRRHDPCAEYLSYHYGGQRGNLLVQILTRRIQRVYRQYRRRKTSRVEPPKKSRTHDRTPLPSHDLLLHQAKLCLDNKRLDDRSNLSQRHSFNYLVSTPKEPAKQPHRASRQRQLFAQSKSTMRSINYSDDSEVSSSNKIIIHTSNSVATSVKLYERHKLLAEELFKFKQARVHNQDIVINRSLYKILIENAFNPQNRSAEHIERYLETLLKAYDNELEAIRKRTKSVPPRRLYTRSERTTRKNQFQP